MAGFTFYLFCLGWKIARYPFDKWQGGPRTWYERCREEKNQSVPGLEPRFSVRPDSRLSQVFTPSPHGVTAPVGQALPVIDALRSHSDTTLPVDFSRRVIIPTQWRLPHNTHNRQASMPPAGFESAIPSGERPQNHALDRASTGIGSPSIRVLNILQRIGNAVDKYRVF